jgi:hypothetical protein
MGVGVAVEDRCVLGYLVLAVGMWEAMFGKMNV